jgi:hypothetical protein
VQETYYSDNQIDYDIIPDLRILSLLAQTVRDRPNNYSKTVISVGSALNPILP